MEKLLPSNNISIQRKLVKYKGKQELADTLHILRYSIGLNLPKCVKDFIDWMAEMSATATASFGVGGSFHAEATIAEQMNCSLSKVEKAIGWMKKHGLMQVVPSWNYSEGQRGTAYKI